jgi:hypothetical protein
VGWLVADTTGEGLKVEHMFGGHRQAWVIFTRYVHTAKASLLVKRHGYSLTPLDDSRLFDALNILLLMQNSTGLVMLPLITHFC